MRFRRVARPLEIGAEERKTARPLVCTRQRERAIGVVKIAADHARANLGYALRRFTHPDMARR